jgi:hypothetical protein
MVCAVLGLYILSWCLYRCREVRTSPIVWDQRSRFNLKTESESSLRNAVFSNINGTMDSVQKHNIYVSFLCLLVWLVNVFINLKQTALSFCN